VEREAETRGHFRSLYVSRALGLEVHAGHGLDYANVKAIAMIPEIAELNIGHFLMAKHCLSG